ALRQPSERFTVHPAFNNDSSFMIIFIQSIISLNGVYLQFSPFPGCVIGLIVKANGTMPEVALRKNSP
ncbi:MAG: hypothetical protein V1724_05030, partial [Chloroflexota bacterium]